MDGGRLLLSDEGNGDFEGQCVLLGAARSPQRASLPLPAQVPQGSKELTRRSQPCVRFALIKPRAAPAPQHATRLERPLWLFIREGGSFCLPAMWTL